MCDDGTKRNDAEGEFEVEKLIEQAKGGDPEAYNELMRQYRSKARHWAYSLTQEAYLAEDVVQEAFTKVYLHLNTLQDSKLFLPWLKRIIKNTALTKRKKMSRPERPIVAYEERADSPEDQVLIQDAYESVKNMIGCLSKREQQIVESLFFHERSATETADLYNIKTGNVYAILSRAKDKIYKQYVHTAIKRYMSKLKEQDRMDKIILKKPEPFLFLSWTTIANSLYLLTRYTNRNNYSFTEVFGLTGQAFRLNLVGNEIHIGGPTSYDWRTIFQEGMSALGLWCKTLFVPAAPNQDVNYQLANDFSKSMEAMEERPIQDRLWEALDLIRDSINRGIPVVTWDIFIPEFGIIYGYDDYARHLYVIDHGKPEGAVLPYEHLGRGLLKDLFVMSAVDTFSIGRIASLKVALKMIIRHAKGNDYNPDTKCVSGIGAYRHWIAAFEKRGIEPVGNAYNIHLVHDARKNAGAFLTEVQRWLEETGESDAAKIAGDASEKYKRAAAHLAPLCELFPFPQGGTPNDPEVASTAVKQLQVAMDAEQAGLQLLEQLLIAVSQTRISSG